MLCACRATWTSTRAAALRKGKLSRCQRRDASPSRMCARRRMLRRAPAIKAAIERMWKSAGKVWKHRSPDACTSTRPSPGAVAPVRGNSSAQGGLHPDNAGVNRPRTQQPPLSHTTHRHPALSEFFVPGHFREREQAAHRARLDG